MPLSEKHKQQRKKNWLLLGLLLVIIGALYQISVIKFGISPQ